MVSRFRQQADQSLYFSGPINGDDDYEHELRCISWKWSVRYFFQTRHTQHPNNYFHNIYLFDLYQNKAMWAFYEVGKTICFLERRPFPRSTRFWSAFVIWALILAWFLKHKTCSTKSASSTSLLFILTRKSASLSHCRWVFLILVNLVSVLEPLPSLHVNSNFNHLQTYECPFHVPKIYVDIQEPSKFVIRWVDRSRAPLEKFVQSAKWSPKGIEFGKPIHVNHQLFWNVGSYHKGELGIRGSANGLWSEVEG